MHALGVEQKSPLYECLWAHEFMLELMDNLDGWMSSELCGRSFAIAVAVAATITVNRFEGSLAGNVCSIIVIILCAVIFGMKSVLKGTL